MHLEKYGYELWDNVLNTDEINSLKTAIRNLNKDIPRYGIRSIHKLSSTIQEFTVSKKILSKANEILKAPATLVSATLFDKSSDENWFVPWHQDRTVPLSKKFDKEGWTNWTKKRGTLYAEAPLEVLEQMVTFRIHLDDAFPENGCLKFISATHTRKLSSNELKTKTSGNFVNCQRNAGDAFIMKPLLLHSSNKSTSPSPRKVLHLEYSSYSFESGINWA